MEKRKMNKSMNVFAAATLTASVVVPVVPASVSAETVTTTDLIISEYVEGSSYNKALEIYNGTGAAVDLSQYTVELYSNGAASPSQSVTLSGTLEDGSTYVLYHGSASEELKAKGNLEGTAVVNFNGDDAIVLKKSDTVIDSFGQVGVDPGSSWGTNVTTADMTLVRNNSILSGDTNPTDEFDPSTEWTGYDRDTFSYLGAHGEDANPDDDDVETPTPTEGTITEVRALPKGSRVTTTGTVTAVMGSTTFIQDDNAGIVLYGNNLNVAPGDKVHATGELTEYRSLLEINVTPETVEVLETTSVPEPEIVSAAQLQEDKEGKLVTVENVRIEAFASGNFKAVDGEGNSFELRPEDSSLLAVGTTYESITGVLGSYNDVYQLIPRSIDDVVEDSSIVRPVVATPGEGLIQEGSDVTLATQTEGATIHYTTDGSEPTIESPVYSEPITITEDTTIKAIAVKDGLTTSDVAEFDYFVQLEELRIHDIQGEGHYSKYDGLNVTDVEGIVTYVNGNEFYLQDLQPDDNSKTSEGILVYKGSHGVKVGDMLSVDGTVKEYVMPGYSERYSTDLPVTEIAASTIEVTGTGELPEAIVLGEDVQLPTEVIDNDGLSVFDPEEDGIDLYESLEGMLVQVNDPKVVALQKYGELTVVPGNMETNTTAGGLRISENDYNPERITIDIGDEDYVAKMGDYFEGNIQGVMSYGYSYYQVLSNKEDLPELIEGPNERETTTITPAEDKLTVASYNVENFSTKTDDEKVTRLAEAIVDNMKTPDIIGLTEVQDNDGATDSGTVDASQSAQVLIDKIVALGGPEYVYTDIAPVDKQEGGAPGGNIRVGFLYNPERVSLSEGTKGSATEAVAYEDGQLTLNPGRIDPTNAAFEDSRIPLAAQFEFKGESVIVVANHFNSKGGDQPLYGKNQPPVLGSEVQRMQIAGIVNGFVKDVLAEDPEANVVLVGDFNDFEFSNPLQTLKGNELTNMIELVPAEERYTYSYQGNAQVLDHILVSNNLVSNTEVDILHINSGFMEAHGRASDHDPVMVQIDLTKSEQPEEEPVDFDKVYDYKGLSKKKLTIPQKNVWISLDEDSKVNEVRLKGQYVELQGEGFRHTTVIFEPKKPGAILDLNGTSVKKIIVDGKNVSEIRGAQPDQVIEYIE
ncbi:chitobiase/beta-hexosaminidase C-terminal domain-containing protein [Ureibacillus aquaedulcis]|uniref:Chitobiase/beta-hexosaminidase C-terminal domain-containing protein n=1 Tax=Ureibacillus aquaedulcis TaxID=3058421 RepID=A0ABT8GL78_9BACL|nr:chitobiase/beta-hexosaminidase C-terminal domain-containing protein [Ureibacillus sp. BA0131]MDN4492165.1 chitobiase/beta-hexosaminidase C-terminal domain-containing protein [Ureibacillus sp. BA0131]